jgi:hypothetical protein
MRPSVSFATAWLEHEHHPGLTALVWAVRPGQQTGSKRLESASLNHADSNREKPEKRHEWSDSASFVVNRRDLRTGLSRRRSRVRAPSLPLKFLQIGILCCHDRRQVGADYTDFFAARPRNARKRAETGRPAVDFRPIQAPLRPTAEDGVRLHEMAGGQGSACRRRRMREKPSAASRSGFNGPPGPHEGCWRSRTRHGRPEAGKLPLVRTPDPEMRKDVREFIRRLEAVGLTVESTPGHYRVQREGKPLRKANGMPFTLPFSSDTIRWRIAAIVELLKLGINLSHQG